MNCPHCQVPLVEGARFCPACGKATSPTESGSNWQAQGGAPDLVGKEIAGRYRIVKKLGEGGMGAVYRGEQISLKRTVAIKVLRPELVSNQALLQRFTTEAQAVGKLSHPNTVIVYEYGVDTDGSSFIAMEYIEGRSLRTAIQQEGPFSVARALHIAVQVAASLSDAHANSIVHRDLKPDNVMLQERGKHKDVVRVLDFGIAKLRDDSRATQAAMTQAGDMLGTPQYMAPEQIKGEAIDGRTGIYALGCMIYEMVTARLPYEAPTIMAMLSKHLMENPVPPSQRRPDLGLPPAIDQLVLSAMAKEPHQRPATMEQFSDMLSTLLAQSPADTGARGPSMQHGAAMGGMPTPIAPSAFQPPTHPPPGAATNQPYGFTPSTPPPGAAPTPPGMGAPPGAFPSSTPANLGYGVPGFASPPIAAPGFAPMQSPGMPVAPSFSPPPIPLGRTEVVPRSSNALLFVILGVLALAGAGAAVWFFVLRDDGKAKTAATDPAKPDPAKPDEHTPRDPDDPPEPDEDLDKELEKLKDLEKQLEKIEKGVPKDPWADTSGAAKAPPGPTPKTIGTSMTPLPKGARIVPPAGFVKATENPTQLAYVNATRGVMIGLGSLDAPSNDPDEIAEHYSKLGMTLFGRDTTMSAGKQRDVLVFTSGAGDAMVMQAIVLYIEPSYRIAAILQAPAMMAADQAFLAEADGWITNNIKLP